MENCTLLSSTIQCLLQCDSFLEQLNNHSGEFTDQIKTLQSLQDIDKRQKVALDLENYYNQSQANTEEQISLRYNLSVSCLAFIIQTIMKENEGSNIKELFRWDAKFDDLRFYRLKFDFDEAPTKLKMIDNLMPMVLVLELSPSCLSVLPFELKINDKVSYDLFGTICLSRRVEYFAEVVHDNEWYTIGPYVQPGFNVGPLQRRVVAFYNRHDHDDAGEEEAAS